MRLWRRCVTMQQFAAWLLPATSCFVWEDSDELRVFQRMDGYSGSDVRLVCKEAAMRPVRKIFDALESHQEGKDTRSYGHISVRCP